MEEEVAVENRTDDEKPHVEVEVEPQLQDDYPIGPHDVFVLIQYHIHVVYNMSEGVLTLYNSCNIFFM